MNPEPLKDKGISEMKKALPEFHSWAEAMGNAGRKVNRPTGKKFFRQEDIKSAVEYLKLKLDKSKLMEHSIYLTGVVNKLIDEAFEDVIEKE